MPESAFPMRCKCRRQAATSLRCARCSVPICPDCSIVAPAGMLCNDCGGIHRSPIVQVSLKGQTLALATGLATGSFGGWLLATVPGLGFFVLFLAYLHGLAVAETTLRVTGRKRGLKMEMITGLSAGAGVVAGWFIVSITPDAAASFSSFLFNPWSLFTVAVSVFGSVNRIRYL